MVQRTVGVFMACIIGMRYPFFRRTVRYVHPPQTSVRADVCLLTLHVSFCAYNITFCRALIITIVPSNKPTPEDGAALNFQTHGEFNPKP